MNVREYLWTYIVQIQKRLFSYLMEYLFPSKKEKRDKVPKAGKERATVNIMQLQTDSQDKNAYKTILAAWGIDVKSLVQAECLAAFGKARRQLPIVAISDGARSIKNDNKLFFGENVIHILDWYHIQAKVKQLLSADALTW